MICPVWSIHIVSFLFLLPIHDLLTQYAHAGVGASLNIKQTSTIAAGWTGGYRAPTIFQSKDDARQAVAFHSFLQGVLDLPLISGWHDFSVTTELYEVAVERLEARMVIRETCHEFGMELPSVEYEEVCRQESELNRFD